MKQGEEGNGNSGETFRISVGIPAQMGYSGALTGDRMVYCRAILVYYLVNPSYFKICRVYTYSEYETFTRWPFTHNAFVSRVPVTRLLSA